MQLQDMGAEHMLQWVLEQARGGGQHTRSMSAYLGPLLQSVSDLANLRGRDRAQTRPGLTSIQQLEQHIVHSAVGVGGDQHRGSCSYQALDHSHHGGALACAWHAHNQRAASSLVHHPARAEPSALSYLLAMRGVQAPLLTPSCAVVQAKQWQIAAEHMDLACHAGGLH